MPKSGFKSYALKEELYNSLQEKYEEDKDELRNQGINSLSAFLTYLMSKNVEEQIKQQKYKQKIEKMRIISDTIVLKDNIFNRIIELKIKTGKIFCEFDGKNDCIHVGYAYSIPEINELLNK
jgi:hypothetical protein